MKNVFVVGGDASVKAMFAQQKDWHIVPHPEDSDYICFTGGADVSPELYNERNQGLSHTDPLRDKRETEIYRQFKDKNFLGICRGGQFLNVMNHGTMIQDIQRMHSGLRQVVLKGGGLWVTQEDHHQGMVASDFGEVLALDTEDFNQEIIWYPKSRSLCFQAHPEWGHPDTKTVFFKYIERLFK